MRGHPAATGSRLPGSQAAPPHVRSRPLASHLAVLAAYFLLTVLMTWPAASHLTTAIPGDGFDGWQNYWNLWWVRQALLVTGTTPFFTDYLYAPTGVSLLFHTLNIFNGLWTLPLQLNFGLPIAYNSVVFFSFVFAGYGGYLLSLDLLARLFKPRAGLRPAAFVGGLIFTMSPFHLAHLLGHMQVFSMVWPPFYVLWLLRALQWPAAGGSPELPAARWRDAVIAGLVLVLASLVDWYQALYLLIFTALALLWTLGTRWRQLASGQNKPSAALSPLFFRAPTSTGLAALPGRPLWQPIWLTAVIGLIFVVALSPLLWPMIREASSRPDLETGLVQNVTLSADLLAFVTPSELHPLWGAWAKTIAGNFSSTTSERLIFAGFVPLALALLALVQNRAKSPVLFWGLVTLVFILLALGPYLHLGGEIVTIGGWRLPLPYLLLYHLIPFIDLTRSLSRYDMMVMLALGVLAAAGAYQLTWDRAGRRNFLPFLMSGLICFEFLAIPYPVSKIEIPAFYVDLGLEAGNYTLAELPMNWDRPTPLLHQTVHRKRLLTAYTSRDNPLELVWRTPVFQHWRYLSPDIIDQPLPVIAPTIFFDFNLRYIVLDSWQMPPGPERAGTEQWLAAALPGASPVYDDGRLKVYQSPPKGATQPYLMLGQGWSDRQTDQAGLVTRTIAAASPRQAELVLHHPQNHRLNLEITAAASLTGTQTLTIFANGEAVDKFRLGPAFSNYVTTLPPLSRDMVKLRLRVDGPAGEVAISRAGLAAIQPGEAESE